MSQKQTIVFIILSIIECWGLIVTWRMSETARRWINLYILFSTTKTRGSLSYFRWTQSTHIPLQLKKKKERKKKRLTSDSATNQFRVHKYSNPFRCIPLKMENRRACDNPVSSRIVRERCMYLCTYARPDSSIPQVLFPIPPTLNFLVSQSILRRSVRVEFAIH